MSNDSYAIYQVKNDDEQWGVRFEPLDRLQAMGHAVNRANYDLVYLGDCTAGKIQTDVQVLDGLYQQFNLEHPMDFAGRSTSVSDVVLVKRGGEAKAYYVDSVGFAEVPEFLAGPFRYYSTQRPIDIGTIPRTPEPEAIINYDHRMPVEETRQFEAWGVVQYAKPLSDKDVQDYELRPSAYNSDVVVMPPCQLEAQLQAVGRWENETAVPAEKRLTVQMPVSGKFVRKEGAVGIALSSRFRLLARDARRSISAQLEQGAAQAEKDNAARPKQPPKDKDKDR